ncbi:MAG: hypothetical protein PHZ26_00785 [Candidatus Gracilibacteria bacterium]|nr:hypothetical protein [Candidatus Gracilibacteria bacterium]MDD2908272.1 hypothetical protein [Candidatus Gracilibacteria bacterium]
MKNTKQIFSKGIIAGVGFSLAILITTLTYAAISNVISGEKLTADKFNQVINAINGGVTVPTGGVMAFNGTGCPTGWIPANGNSIPMVGGGINALDLRGTFVRGMNSFENGDNLISTGSGDPDGLRTLGSYQTDEFKNHSHSLYTRIGTMGHTAGVYPSSGDLGTMTDQGFNAVRVNGGTETRPRNIALLYCVKQ